MIQVSAALFPTLYASFRLIEAAKGNPLGDAVQVPADRGPLVAMASQALARLRSSSEEDWEIFVCGDQEGADAIFERQGDLTAARQLLEDFYNGWPSK